MAPLQAEAAWQLGEWKQLEEFTSLRNNRQNQHPDNATVGFFSMNIYHFVLIKVKHR